jgi:hypothetical protein
MPRRPTLPPTLPRSESVPTDVPPAGDGLAGVASWYCNSDRSRGPRSRCTVGHPDDGGADLFAAIRRDLLYLRGQRVSVCAGERCVRVRIIDCNCGPGANIIDLYADAFEALRPLGVGRVKVRVIIP